MAADGGKQQQTIAYGGLVASAAAMLGLALLAASSGTDPNPKPAPHAQPAVVPAVPATVPAVQPVATPESEDTGGSTPSEPAAQTDSASENVSPAPSEGSTATAVAGTKLACYREPPSRIFTLDEVRADHGDETWVVLSDTRGVYNMTPFLDAHAGGPDRIRMVNGQDLAAFWKVYSDIHDRPHIRDLLEEYRIGSLSEEDTAKIKAETRFGDAYVNEPTRVRAADYRIPSRKPWNSEPRLELLWENYFTPNDLFFIRNHNPVPDIDGDEWELEIDGNPAAGIKGRTFTLKQLKEEFPKHEVVSSLQCAGNRQEDFVSDGRPLYVAPHWRNGAIGNAKWGGVRVRDILRACGMDVDGIVLGHKSLNGMKIVNFIAEDTDETGTPYAGVIPIEKAIDPWGDAILAYEMNGETLPRDHGFPVRLLAPGTAGCRNPKWVRQIIVSAEASELDSGSRLDRHFAPDISFDEHKKHVDPTCDKSTCRVRVDQGPVIQTLPVQSVICVPADRATLSGAQDTVHVKGIAYSGAGRGITRVELSIDGGRTFTAAELLPAPVQSDVPAPEAGMGRNWAWQRFEQKLALPDDIKAKLAAGEKVNLEVVSKAIDGDFNSQPADVAHVWNVLGICVNHWCRVNVTLDPELKPQDPLPPPPPAPPAGSCKWGECGDEEGECVAPDFDDDE